jgi:hypothetical protein
VSVDESGGAASRPSNGSNPAQAGRGPDAADLSRPERVAREFMDKYQERAFTDLTEVDGRELRREVLTEETAEREVLSGPHDETERIEELIAREPETWAAAIVEFCEFYEKYPAVLKMGKGEPHQEEYEEFEVPIGTSWSQEYQEREYAEYQAIERETCGGERPSGAEESGAFEDPVTVIVTLSGSAVPEGEPLPPVDHNRSLVEAWTGDGDDGARRSFRYVMGEKLGLDKSDYIYRRQGEPHPGGGHGKNAAYGHTHIEIVMDAAAACKEPEESDFRPVVNKHVEECEYAEPEAHGDDAIELRGDLESPAAYMSKYVANDPEKDLYGRSVEYIAWGAIQFVSRTQKYTQSNTASAAIKADRCKQEYESSESDQECDHGGVVVRSERPGHEYECRCCGSPWRIEQDQTLTEHRTEEPEELAAEVSELRGRWPSASGGAKIDVSGMESFDVVPTWEPKAVVIGGEEVPIRDLGSDPFGSVKFPGDPIPPEKLIPPRKLRRPDPPVDPTEYPPPELIERQLAERADGRELTPKEWPEDWHDERYSGGC